jgi:hypothetical protein
MSPPLMTELRASVQAANGLSARGRKIILARRHD